MADQCLHQGQRGMLGMYTMFSEGIEEVFREFISRLLCHRSVSPQKGTNEVCECT